MIKLLEYEHQIHVDAKTELKKYTVQHALLDAQITRRYAKFICGRYYISVIFNRDGTIHISSNYRYNMVFNKELEYMEQRKYTLNTTTDFIWRWMNKIRKLR
jgi:hypothetical protein